MLKQIIKIICGVVIILSANKTFAATSEITIKELVTGGQEEFHLRIYRYTLDIRSFLTGGLL